MNHQKAIQLLNLKVNYSDDELKKAFRSMAMKFHPDKNKSPQAKEKFVEIYDAYNFLKDYKKNASNIKYKSYSQKSTNNKTKRQSSKWEYSYRHHRSESFEERYERAKRATEERMNKDEEKIIKSNFDEYMNGWKRKYVKILAPIAAILSIFLTIDYFLPAKKDYYSNVQLVEKNEIFGRPDVYIVFKNEKILINREIQAFVKYNKVSAQVLKRAIFGDIISVNLIESSNNIKIIKPNFNIHQFFPIFHLLFLLPLISFFIEKPKFYFIFFVVYTNVYVVTATLIIVLSNRIQTLLNIF